MICSQCGAEMDQTDKNTFTGREIREYECRACGHSDWEDCGVALWQAMHDANREDRQAQAEAATPHSDSLPDPPANKPGLFHRLIRIFRK